MFNVYINSAALSVLSTRRQLDIAFNPTFAHDPKALALCREDRGHRKGCEQKTCSELAHLHWVLANEAVEKPLGAMRGLNIGVR
jgi:hypothetical protein